MLDFISRTDPFLIFAAIGFTGALLLAGWSALRGTHHR